MPALILRLCACGVLVLPLSCRGTAPTATERPAEPAPAPAAPVAPPKDAKPDATTLAEPEPTPEPDPKTKAEALARYERGEAFFREGRYDEAEVELKEALSLYPFMASANLVLGKVFLIRGAAAHDEVMIDSARLMFKMALSIDPELREAGVLLSLFKGPGSFEIDALKERAEPLQ